MGRNRILILRHLPEAILRHPNWGFSRLRKSWRISRCGTFALPRNVSWAIWKRDISAWSGNEMQKLSLSRAYSLAHLVGKETIPQYSKPGDDS